MSDIILTDNAGGNYFRKLDKLRRNMFPPNGIPPAGLLIQVDCKHDDWCGIFDHLPCDCDPDLSIREIKGSNSA